MRSLTRETRLTPESLVYPLFVCPGDGVRKEIRSMPGVYNLSVDQVVREAEEAHSLGVPALILFGLPETKDDVGTGAWEENGIVQRAARAIKRELPEMLLVGDVCLCEYMLTPREELLRLLATKSFRLGQFKLASGGTSDYYIDCRITTLDARGAQLTGQVFLDEIRSQGWNPEAIGGLTMHPRKPPKY